MLYNKPDKRRITLSDHKQVEQVLRHLGMIIEQSNDAVAVVDLRGVVHLVNTAWTEMHGYKKGTALLARSIRSFQGKDQMEADVVCLIKEAGDSGRLVKSMTHVRKDGTPFAAKIRVTVLADECGNAIGLIIFAADAAAGPKGEGASEDDTARSIAVNEQLNRQVTDHKRSEEYLRQEMSKLAAANKEFRDQLVEREQAEKQLKQQLTELTAAYEELQGQTVAGEQTSDRLDRLASVLTGVCEQFGSQITEHAHANSLLKEQIGELSEAAEQIEHQAAGRELSDEDGDLDGSEAVMPPFDAEKLKAVSDLAKQLSGAAPSEKDKPIKKKADTDKGDKKNAAKVKQPGKPIKNKADADEAETDKADKKNAAKVKQPGKPIKNKAEPDKADKKNAVKVKQRCK
jgi:PAS domain S-box-containing protein